MHPSMCIFLELLCFGRASIMFERVSKYVLSEHYSLKNSRISFQVKYSSGRWRPENELMTPTCRRVCLVFDVVFFFAFSNSIAPKRKK